MKFSLTADAITVAVETSAISGIIGMNWSSASGASGSAICEIDVRTPLPPGCGRGSLPVGGQKASHSAGPLCWHRFNGWGRREELRRRPAIWAASDAAPSHSLLNDRDKLIARQRAKDPVCSRRPSPAIEGARLDIFLSNALGWLSLGGFRSALSQGNQTKNDRQNPARHADFGFRWLYHCADPPPAAPVSCCFLSENDG